MVVVQFFLPAILSLLLPSEIRQKGRPKRRLHQVTLIHIHKENRRSCRTVPVTFSGDLSCYRRYLPVLKNFPTRYIHEPWNAPLSVQRAAKCIVGKDYSLPMVNHSKSSRINIERMKQVYQQLNKYRGNGMFFTHALRGRVLN